MASEKEWALYFSIGVPFVHFANFSALMDIMGNQIESCFMGIGGDADATWVIRTDYNLEDSVEHLRDHCGFKVEIHETADEADKARENVEWEKGLAKP